MNIAELLKYCPKGTKLYSTVFGEVKFSEVYPDSMIAVLITGNCKRAFRKDGSYSEYGECVLFPSKDQKDWDKFRIPVKRGDIMMSNGRAFIISDEYADTFIGKYHGYICGIDAFGNFIVSQSNHHWTNSFYIPASEEAKKELFDKMKEAGYKWNTNTLKLEKIEPELKEGEVYVNRDGDLYLLVGKIAKDIGKAAILYLDGNFIAEAALSLPDEGLVLATPSDKNKLLSFLNRKGYKYDKKQYKLIKQEFKPFDKVLVRNSLYDNWISSLFSHYNNETNEKYPFICINDTYYRYCMPYNGNEYLLGTAKPIN